MSEEAVALVDEVRGFPEPSELFLRLAGVPWVLWLDSALPAASRSRYSFLALDPFRVLRGRGGRSEWVDREGARTGAHDPLGELEGEMTRYRLPPNLGLPPFCGGAGGFFGYELASDIERVPPSSHRDLPIPDLELGLYDLVVGWDRKEDRCWIAATGAPERGAAARERAARRLRQAREWLSGGSPPSEHGIGGGTELNAPTTEPPITFPVPDAPGFRSTFSPEGYREAVRRAIDWIRSGDVYQVNLSQRFEVESDEEPTRLYRRLRDASPAPFGAYFAADGFAVLSNSPELFLHVTTDGLVRTRPIKGTRPRSCDPEEDGRLAAELQASDKDRAENLMIVDLLRNDLSRVCRPESVRAVELFAIESYRTVHHLVSTVDGRLREGRGRTDLLRATFPSGSVTGAPKIRAMEIISELEPVARGPYCGAIGYLGFAGDLNTSVSIRIAVAAHGKVVFHAGGAVVADSDPAAEYEETLDKARALVSAIPRSVP